VSTRRSPSPTDLSCRTTRPPALARHEGPTHGRIVSRGGGSGIVSSSWTLTARDVPVPAARGGGSSCDKQALGLKRRVLRKQKTGQNRRIDEQDLVVAGQAVVECEAGRDRR
jgi:hypothetical protein